MPLARPVVALWLGVCLATLTPPAAAQEPSARELRDEYPLHSEPAATAEPGPSSSATAEPGPSSSAPAEPARGAAAGDGDGPSLALFALTAVAVGGVLALLVLTRRGGGRRPSLAAIAPALRRPEPALSAGPAVLRTTGPRERDAAPAARLWKREGPAASGSPAPVPPAADRAWTAEIEWRHGEGSSRFCAVARTAGQEDGAPIAESDELAWPPTTPAAMRALSQAAEQLEASLLAAGWTRLPPGEAWYAKRFAWEPRAAPSGRFLRWPKGTQGLWRCEITWDAGYVKSRFKAVIQHPGQRRRHEVGASPPFKWMLMGDPDPVAPEYEREVRRLAAALEAAGWEHVGRGAAWYSERFVWRGEGEPPGHVEEQRRHGGST